LVSTEVQEERESGFIFRMISSFLMKRTR
jgi:hypothetical protein